MIQILLILLLFSTDILASQDRVTIHTSCSVTPKDLVLDTDLDTEDVVAILYLLKQNRSLINLKAIALDSNAWVSPGFGVNILYDVLFMMGRDDIPVGVGGEGGIGEDGTIHPNVGGYLPIIDQRFSTAGSCRYRQAIPPGRGAATLDVDTHYGLRRKFLPQGQRHYIPGKQKAAQQVLLEALSSGSNTVLLTGSHTNFALLLMSHPEVKKNIEHVYIMGGGETGNLFTAFESNPRAEFNIFADPFASYQVFHSGLPITLVPLEATDTVPVSEELISALERSLNSLEANYTYQILNMYKHLWPGSFSKYFYLWDSFAASVAVSGMLNGHKPLENQFADIHPANLTVVTSNRPYGIRDGSNPLFETQRWKKFGLEKDGVHSGHVQTGLRDPFCYIAEGTGTCMDGCTMQVSSNEGVLVQLARSATRATKYDLDKQFYLNFIEALNSQHQTARFSWQSGFPSLTETQYKPNSTRLGGRPVIFDMDMSPGDILALFYLLKVPRTSIDIQAITVTANGFANGAAVDVVYDVLHMMGRDDIPVGLGSFFALGQAYSSSRPFANGVGDCKYRRAIPQGAGGLLDSDTLYGLAGLLPRGPRRYVGEPGKTPTASQELVNALRNLEHGSKLTLLTGGPLTNIAEFIAENEDLKHLIQEVFVLGGSINKSGDVFTVEENTKAQFNMFLDPEAARQVLSSKLNITLVPLDVTSQVSAPGTFLKRLKIACLKQHRHTPTPESALVHKLLRSIRQLKAKDPAYRHAANPLSEVVAAALLVDSKVSGASFREVGISVEASGNISTDGWTRIVENGARIRYAEALDSKALDFQVANALTEAVVPSFAFQQELAH